MFKKVLKLILKIIGIFVLLMIVVAGTIFAYYHFCVPDIIKNFNTYDGIAFDYTLEEDAYKDKLYYKQLSDSEARHYRCMYHAASNDESYYYLQSGSLFDSDEAGRAVRAFDLDFPEYYWFGQVISTDFESSKDSLNLLDFNYAVVKVDCNEFSDEDISSNRTLIDNKLNEILPTLTSENDYETIKNVYDYVIDNVEYDLDTMETSDIRAAFINGKGVCSSYAETFQMICNRLGYECYSVQGKGLQLIKDDDYGNNDSIESTDDLGHEWDIININNNWYWVDPTWGDSNEESYDLNNKLINRRDYSYFLVPDRIFFIDHVCDDLFTYPNCYDESYYLYDNSSAILDTYDESLINKYIINALKDGATNFTFHFTNEEDMNALLNWVDRKKLYELYQNNIYEYYSGSMKCYISNNYSIYMEWNITNLY